jgi:2-polyprenyl-3-methyl-5-hydroxy-6-metoxy-1,4-benzoquinol methylase
MPGSGVLDIGCGVGALHLALLKQGAARATAVDASEGMLNAAMHFGQQQGVGEQVTYIHGDFVHAAGGISEADITVMDKVVCCYEDVIGLIDASTAKTKHLLALTHPRDNLIGRVMFKAGILLAKLFRSSFHPFWHDWGSMREHVVAKGFRLVHQDSTPFWQAVVFERQ